VEQGQALGRVDDRVDQLTGTVGYIRGKKVSKSKTRAGVRRG